METMSITEFMRKERQDYVIVLDASDIKRGIGRHLKKHGTKYAVTGISLVLVGTPTDVFASTGIDKGATKIYLKLVNIGKWVIIVKGGIDIITSITNGDVDAAKKRFFGYLMAYGALFALPWGMGEVERLFEDESVFKE
jgi:hypothetical protein